MPEFKDLIGLTDTDKAHMSKLDRVRYAAFLIWMIIGVIILLVLTGIAIGSIWSAVSVMIVSALIVFILNPGVNFLERHHVKRGWGALIMFVIMLAVIVALLVGFVPAVFDQTTSIVAQLPAYYDQFMEWFNGFQARYSDTLSNPVVQQWVSSMSSQIMSFISDRAGSMVSNLATAGSELMNDFIIVTVALVVSFWILLDYHRMAHEMHILAGPHYDSGFTFFNTVCSRVFAGYIKGTLIGCLCVGVLSGLGFWACGIPYAAVLGALTGVFTLVPYIGPIVIGIIVAIFALFGGVQTCILSIIVSVLAQWVVANLISPRIMSSTVNLHPCIILVVIIVGGALGGIFGMLVAIPVTAIAKDMLVYWFERRTGRQIVTNDGALFKGAPSADVDPVSDATDQYLSSADLAVTVDNSTSGYVVRGRRKGKSDHRHWQMDSERAHIAHRMKERIVSTGKQERAERATADSATVNGSGSDALADTPTDEEKVFDWLDDRS